MSERLLTAGEVAELLAVPERWVRQATRDGILPVIPLGRYRRYDRADVIEWVESLKTGGRHAQLRKYRPTAA